MRKPDLAPNFPVEIDLKIMVTNGEQFAVATFSLPPGKMPTYAEIAAAMEESLSGVREQLDKQWRLATRQEFLREKMRERTGMTVATPDGAFVKPCSHTAVPAAPERGPAAPQEK